MKTSAARLDLISQLVFALSRQLKERMHSHQTAGLSMLHLGTLHFINEHGQPLMSDVAEHLCITRPSATSLMQGLVRSGYVQRQTDKHDGRTVSLKLTAAGKQILSRGFRQMNKQIRELVSELDPTEQQQFIGILTKLVSRL